MRFKAGAVEIASLNLLLPGIHFSKDSSLRAENLEKSEIGSRDSCDSRNSRDRRSC
jgi:hypothetical protein